MLREENEFLRAKGVMKMKMLHIFAFTLVSVGALNWGFVGLFSFNLVNALLGSVPALENLVYVLVGASAVYVFATHMKECKMCVSIQKAKN